MSELKRNFPPTALERKNSTETSFSQRVKDGTIKCDLKSVHSVANTMLLELNGLAARSLILQHKLIEVIKVAPRFVSEYLQVDFEQKTRERWQESIFRHVSVTHNFALLPIDEQNENIGENHKNIAKIKRKAITQ